MATPDIAFWSGRKVLITGHTGFKGSWLTIWLEKLGANLQGIGLPPITSPSLFEAVERKIKIHSHVGDITNREYLEKRVAEFRPEVIFHLAAQPLVSKSYDEPSTTFHTNLMGSVNILEAARLSDSVKALINVTSDKCYEPSEAHRPYKECDPLGGHDPYSASKACAEIISSAYHKSFLGGSGVGVATARAGNVIGGGDWSPNRLVPDILRADSSRQMVELRSPHAIRPWQHVLEPLCGYILLAENITADASRYSGPWNFGPAGTDQVTVEMVAKKLVAQLGNEIKTEITNREWQHETEVLRLDISKASQQLGWKPKWNLDTALARVVEWHNNWKRESDIVSICTRQIDQYVDEN